jgi:hypothetical protein
MKNEIIKELVSMLKRGWVSFSFIKKDGSYRYMEATTKIDLIPEEVHPIGASKKKNSNQICVYDRTVGEWRSITESTDILELKEL